MKVYACIDTERAIAHFERSIRLSPRDPEMALTLTGIAFAHLIEGHNEQALAFVQPRIHGPQFTSGHRVKITALIFVNREQEARAAAEMLLTYDPQFKISSRLPGYRNGDFQQRYHAALKELGCGNRHLSAAPRVDLLSISGSGTKPTWPACSLMSGLRVERKSDFDGGRPLMTHSRT